MPRVTQKQVAALPQSSDTWFFSGRKLRTWVAEPGRAPARPFGNLIYSLEHDLVLGSRLELGPPTKEQVLALLFRAMASPLQGLSLKPQRPARLALADAALGEAVTPSLARVGVPCVIAPVPKEVSALLRDLERHLRKAQRDVPGLLEVEGVTPDLVRDLFAAAADFYRAQPWLKIGGEQTLAVRVSPEVDFRYAQVMGNAGMEYGLGVFTRWEDIDRFENVPDGGEPGIPPEGVHSLLFDDATLLPFADLDGIEDHGWPIAGETALPLPMIYKGKNEAARPSRAELLWYEAALRAIPVFVDEHMTTDGEGRSLPVEATIPVRCHGGKAEVLLRFPAREMAPEEHPASVGFMPPAEDVQLQLPHFDRRAMEGDMAGLVPKAGGSPAKRRTKLQRAQDLMYQAWAETNPAQRLILAHQALALSPDCADAYVLLAEEEADTLGHALELWQQGVEAGERALGKRYFEKEAGNFWMMLETRPYMRALEGLAGIHWRMGRKGEAAARYREMLRLNPGDNQGMRYLLLELLLELGRTSEAEALLQENEEDTSAAFEYNRALLAFQRSHDDAKATRLLRAALHENPHVPAYLMLEKRVPARLPDYVGWGDENEAAAYAASFLNFWRRTAGAVEWLRGVLQTSSSESSPRRQDADRRRKRHRKHSG